MTHFNNQITLVYENSIVIKKNDERIIVIIKSHFYIIFVYLSIVFYVKKITFSLEGQTVRCRQGLPIFSHIFSITCHLYIK